MLKDTLTDMLGPNQSIIYMPKRVLPEGEAKVFAITPQGVFLNIKKGMYSPYHQYIFTTATNELSIDGQKKDSSFIQEFVNHIRAFVENEAEFTIVRR
jgi:hypothetical protein